VTIHQLVPRPVRRHFRDLAAQTSTLRLIAGMWEDQGFIPSGEPNDEGGERRTLWHEYEDNVDWTDPGHVMRVLRVYETLLDGISEGVIEREEIPGSPRFRPGWRGEDQTPGAVRSGGDEGAQVSHRPA
jgi:hypothetical protein